MVSFELARSREHSATQAVHCKTPGFRTLRGWGNERFRSTAGSRERARSKVTHATVKPKACRLHSRVSAIQCPF